MKDIENEVRKENTWCQQIAINVAQPFGTPLLDKALVTSFESVLQDKREDHFWPHLQLKTRESK